MDLKINVEVAESNLAELAKDAGSLEGIVSEISSMMTTLSSTYQGVSSGVIAGAISDFNTKIGTIESAIVGVQKKVQEYITHAKEADAAASLAVNDGASNG